jgi:hypothetical protein
VRLVAQTRSNIAEKLKKSDRQQQTGELIGSLFRLLFNRYLLLDVCSAKKKRQKRLIFHQFKPKLKRK